MAQTEVHPNVYSRKMDKQIMIYAYILKAIKRMKHRCKDMDNLKNIMPMLRERSQTQKNTYYLIWFLWHFCSRQHYGERSQKRGGLELEVEHRLTGRGTRELSAVRKMFCILIGDRSCGITYAGVCIYQNSSNWTLKCISLYINPTLIFKNSKYFVFLLL